MPDAALSPNPRVAIVTGGSRGLGAAIGRHLAAAGAIAHLVCRERRAAAEAVAAEIAAAGGVARVQLADVGVEEDVRRLVRDVVAQDSAVHILVNNAGIIDDRLAMATSTAAWERVLRVNLTGPFLLCREVIPLMLDAGWGRIINLSSASAHTPAAGQAAYAAAKAGLEGLTRALAAEVGRKGIRVNAVAPGAIETDMTAGLSDLLGADAEARWGHPDEIGALVAFLASEAAAHIQGQVIVVDGGRGVCRALKRKGR